MSFSPHLTSHLDVLPRTLAYGFRQLRAQYAKYRPPALPQHNADPSNPYANNPPPPAAGSYYPNQQSGNDTNWNQNSYGNNPPAPAQTYQPSTAAQYKAGNNAEGQEHGYEWEQAREQERLERENGGGGNNGPAPPGYDVANSGEFSLKRWKLNW